MNHGPEERPAKLCLKCARRKLAKKKMPPCGDCILLNVDHLAQVRANHARPSPSLRYPLPELLATSSLSGEHSSMPAIRRTAGKSA